MKKILQIILLLIGISGLNAQTSCSEIMEYVKNEGYGSTYYSYDSDAISQVTFYEISDDSYNTYYYAIVQFTSSYNEYISSRFQFRIQLFYRLL